MEFLDEVSWNSDGLVPAIAQDAESGVVLMLAWMNRDALALTVKEKRVVYWSRSRQQLWRKGETSGHVQELIELRLDCDTDAVLMRVNQLGGIACHTGRQSRFYQHLTRITGRQWTQFLKTPRIFTDGRLSLKQAQPSD